MKTQDTIAGNYYGITSPNGCTVTDELGKLKKTVEAGDQLTVQAPGAKLIVDDDEAVIIKAPFKRAALALGLLGGGVKVGLNKYAHCETVEDLIAVNADYKNDLTTDGEWVYPLPKLTTLQLKNKNTGAFQSVTALKKWRGELPKLKNGNFGFVDSNLQEWDIDLPSLETAVHFLPKTVKKFKGDLSSLVNGTGFFWWTSSITVFESELPKLSSGEWFFYKGKLDKESALRVLNSIPAYTSGSHKLTIGIHVDHQTVEDVIAAIAEAEEKGWTLEVQWNGTATAAAASTFAMRQPVYAKLGEPLEDGTPRLAWGHYVTDWEQNGYMEFATLEAAKEYFNITD